MSLSFLGKKGFHPSNPKNLKKLFEAEEKKSKEEKMREELARQHAHESELRENRGHMVKGGHSSGPVVPERSAAMAFMEQLPPGMAEAIERQKGVKQGTKAEAQAEKFPILTNAPRQGDFTKDLAVHHRPFGVDLQHTKCSRCQGWGHRLGDRECPMRDQNPLDQDNKARMDPLAGGVQVGQESSGLPLRWDLKNGYAASYLASGATARGGASTAAANQQYVLGDTEEAGAAGRGASLDDIDPSVLAALSKKQQKKLLKMYTHELKEAAREEAGGADSGGADSGGERKRKREKKEKKGKKEKKEKKKRKKRRRSGSSSGSDESD